MADKNIIIGITGTLGAGKGTIVEYLKEEKGCNHYSSTAFIVEEIKRRGMPVNRDSMVVVANDMRAKNGPGYIAESLYKKAKQDGDSCIIESLRTPGEIEALKKEDKFYMLAVDADSKERYARIKKRGGSKDKISYGEFIENEEREMTTDNPNKQNLSKCIQMADYKFDNSGSQKDLYKQVDKALGEIYKK